MPHSTRSTLQDALTILRHLEMAFFVGLALGIALGCAL